MDRVLDEFEERASRIAVLASGPADIVYDAAFGRPLDYYTGLVYEIVAVDSERPVAGGGRYDRLLTLLGTRQEIPGVGFSVWLDRLEAVASGGAAA
jgi:ATP phosphoribosyltransferase regulatory subunit